MTENNELYELIAEIVNKYVETIWITPYTTRRFIPSENIWKLKDELFNALKGREEKSLNIKGGKGKHAKTKNP